MKLAEQKEMISNMSSICRNCKHIKVRAEHKIFWCTKFNMAVMGVILNCPEGFVYK